MYDICYTPQFVSHELSDSLYKTILTEVNFQSSLLNDKGEWKNISRKMAYVSDNGVDYHYTDLTVRGEKWSLGTESIRNLLNQSLNLELNSCLLNLYKDGKDEIRWHSDKEAQLGDSPTICCVNFGTTRKFHFRSKITKEEFHIPVSHGDLLIMGPNCQRNFLHAILKEPEIIMPRLSLTFRRVYENS